MPVRLGPSINQWSVFGERGFVLHLVVNGFAAEFLSLHADSVNRDGARFSILRDSDLSLPHQLSYTQRLNIISMIVDHPVADSVVSQISLHRVSFAVELADPDAVCRFPILICPVDGNFDFVTLFGVNDRVVLPHCRWEI